MQSATNQRVIINLKRLIWVYFFLLIFEGVFRKWLLPQFSDVLLVVRDPVVLLIYAVAIKSGLSDAEAQDVVQETVITVARAIHTFKRDRTLGSFKGWLRNITHNKLHEYWRRQRKEPEARDGLADWPAEPPEDDSVEAAPPSERCLLVRRALELIRGEFQPQTWEVAWQVLVEGRCAPDVARDFGIQVGTVYTAKSRVLKRLREEYQGLLT